MSFGYNDNNNKKFLAGAKVCVGFLQGPWFPPTSQSWPGEVTWRVYTVLLSVSVGVVVSGSAVDGHLYRSGFCFAPSAAGMGSGHLYPELE